MNATTDRARPLIVGIGGTDRSNSSSELALRVALDEALSSGCDVEQFSGERIALPMYSPEARHRTKNARDLVTSLLKSDGIIISSPGYHGSIPGLLKNVLDYAEDLRNEDRPYLEGRAVGLIVCAQGAQATGTTLVTLRSIVHSLRGWPTPLAVTINTSAVPLPVPGSKFDATSLERIGVVVKQVVDFARMSRAHR